MTDCFAVLGLPRRPWLDPEELKERLHRLTAEHHPDVAGGSGDRFRGINAAYSTLQEPKTRIAHLLELEGFAAETGREIPPALAERFMRTGAVRQRLESFLAKEAKASSPIARAAFAAEKFELIDVVESQLAELSANRDALFGELREIDASWPESRGESAARLAEIAHGLAFLSRWIGQLREGLLELSLRG